ncbi:MAG TPA: VOC family protein [Polyangiaceae bacterium]|nr:VOC family protein [Polyangiaceae bacterium]
MAITSISPYLSFNGNADRALELYQKAFGAKVESLMRWGEHEQGCQEGDKDKIMHASLQMGETRVMLSDSPEGHARPPGGNVQVAVNVDARDQFEQIFKALSEGGQVVMEPHDAFWGDRFALLADRFGVQWMLTCPLKKS